MRNLKFSIIPLYVLLIILLLLTITPTTALTVKIENGTAQPVVKEGDLINLEFTIMDWPAQTARIELQTDLEPYATGFLWNITNADEPIIGAPESGYKENIIMTDILKSNRPIRVNLTGQIPRITLIKPINGVVLKKLNSHKTGYSYYNIRTIDQNGLEVGHATTRTFDIDTTWDNEYRERIRGVKSEKLRSIIDNMYQKGLVDEADILLDYNDNSGMFPFSWFIVLIFGGVIMIMCAFVIGMRWGYRKGFAGGKKEEGSGKIEDPIEDQLGD